MTTSPTMDKSEPEVIEPITVQQASKMAMLSIQNATDAVSSLASLEGSLTNAKVSQEDIARHVGVATSSLEAALRRTAEIGKRVAATKFGSA